MQYEMYHFDLLHKEMQIKLNEKHFTKDGKIMSIFNRIDPSPYLHFTLRKRLWDIQRYFGTSGPKKAPGGPKRRANGQNDPPV